MSEAQKNGGAKVVPLLSRMRLDGVIRGKVKKPIRVTVYGGSGVGKTTFGANAPKPIFLGAEDGTAQLDVARFPKPETFEEVLEAVRILSTEQHDFQTLVIDSLDWIEPLIWRKVCQSDGVELIEHVGGGYGKGYTAAIDDWRMLFAALERLQAAKGVHVVLIAHGHIKTFKNPETAGDYDRYQLKLNERASGLVKEWSDALLFARHEVLVHKDGKHKSARARGVETGARILCTNERAAFDAKNRYSLPDTLPLSWPDFEAAVRAGQPSDPGALKSEIERKAKQLGGDIERLALETLEKCGDSPANLAVLNNRLNAKLTEMVQQSEEN